jgi:hypothetical protein
LQPIAWPLQPRVAGSEAWLMVPITAAKCITVAAQCMIAAELIISAAEFIIIAAKSRGGSCSSSLLRLAS